jgi:hypothetical protein
MEELKPVFLEIRAKDKEKFNSILKVIKLTFSSVKIQDLIFDKIDDKLLVSFNITQKHYNTLIEKLTLNHLDVISTEAADLEIINSAKGKLRKKDNAGFDGWDTIANYGKPSKNLSIEELVKNGDYIELIKIINDLTLDNARREKAKEGLGESIENRIKKLYGQAMISKREAEQSVTKLVDIASNGFLIARGENKGINRAMEIAFDIASQNPDTVNLLIDIANNKSLQPINNLRAIILFASIVFNDRAKYSRNIKYANLYLNIKWLIKIYDKVKSELSSNEKRFLKDVIILVNRYRTRA